MSKLFSLFFIGAILIFSMHHTAAQVSDSNGNNLFALYENACDQEGMFYFPPTYRSGNVGGSKLVNEKKLQAATKSSNQKQIQEAATNLAFLMLEEGNNEQAISYFSVASDAVAQLNRQQDVAVYKLLTGYVHYMSLDHEKAISFFSSGLKYAQTINAESVVPIANALIGQSHLAMKNFTDAGKYFQSAYNGFESQNKKYEQARIGVQLAEIAIRKGEIQQAEKFLNLSWNVFETVNDKAGKAMVLRDRGLISFRQNKFEDAVLHFRNSLALSDQLSVAKLLKDAYLKIFTFYSLSGDHQKSNEINITYVTLRDSIDQAERSRVLNSQFTRRELVEKEAVSEMLRKNPEISFKNMTPQEMEQNRQLIEVEIERLEKEKIIEDLNVAKKLSDQANLEREERILQLTREKERQELALTQKELEVNKAQSVRTNLAIAFVFIVIIVVGLYNRYRNQQKSHAELDKAYKQLSETHQKLIAAQEQLVHSQKMASLGQLTAGIAHEIQNPLNFVNNFSELSIELLEELRNTSDDKDAIIKDLSANLEKINSHGKRADKIVKGMLTHSRAGQTEKTAADINKMIDELLDLSYHGNRTRDTTFTADILKNLDPNLPKIQIVMQDISRVFINLFNNAFYAVAQRVKNAEPGYTPTVGVSTRLEKGYVVIKIRDNGTGIPEHVLKKIFDPFFTTKPAGEGTGLGLSLSYDIIVKGHHGKMEVSSEPFSYTEFSITLPINELTTSNAPEI